jgi:hypothetical protein
MGDPTGHDERTIESALRDILEPLDRQIARVTMLLPLALVIAAPTIFCVLWFVVDETGRRSLVMTGGACCTLIALYLCWEMLAARLARWRFDRRFPPGSPLRALALHILAEMETPSKAADDLRSALACSSPDRIVRHRKRPTDELTLLPEQTPPDGVPAQAPRPGGYYDYIPLEPRPRQEGAPKDH